MITAETLKTLTTFTTEALHRALGKAGKDYAFTGSKFLGLTNGNQFCYHVVHEVKGGSDSAKVFLTYDPALGKVSADIG
jgi:hypothetical protein